MTENSESHRGLSDEEDCVTMLFEGIHRLEGTSEYMDWLELYDCIMEMQAKNIPADRLIEITENYSSLSEDAKHVLNLVFNTPDELQEQVEKKRIQYRQLMKADIKRFLVRCGWPYNKINRIFREVIDFIGK